MPPSQEHPPTEASLKRLLTFARYGARIDKELAQALRALRALKARATAQPRRSRRAHARTRAVRRSNPVRTGAPARVGHRVHVRTQAVGGAWGHLARGHPRQAHP